MDNTNQHTTETVKQPHFAVPQSAFIAPQNIQYTNNTNDDEIDLAELWRAIWAGKLLIIIITAVFAVSAVFYALAQPNIYKASAILSPASSEGGAGGLAGLAGQFGGLASLAGINLGGSSGDKTALALEVIKSRSFIENFISTHQLLVPLMAAKGWNVQTNELIFDDEIYNSQNNQWLRDVKFPKTPEPSLWEAYKEFSTLLSVSQDKTSVM